MIDSLIGIYIQYKYTIQMTYWINHPIDSMNRNIVIAVIAVIVIIAIGAALFIRGNEDEDVKIVTGNDTRLTVLGNADLDDDIDNADIKAIEKIIDIGGTASEYPYADANNDGVIDSKDTEFVKKMISKEKMRIWYYNVDGEIASVSYPMTGTIVATYNKTLEACRTLGLSDKVIGTDDMTFQWPTYFPEFQSLPTVGNRMTPNVEKILDIDPDAYLCGTKKWFGATLESDLAGKGIDILRIPTWEEGKVLSGMITLGFITDHEKQASQYIDWADGILKKVNDVVSKKADGERPKVLVLDADKITSTKKEGSGQYENSVYAGGYNIVKDIGHDESYYTTLTMEWILQKDPDYIIFSKGSTAYQWSDAQLKEKYNALAEDFRLTSAYEKGNMHILNLEIFIGPSYPISVMYMAKWFYPEEFASVDVSELMQEYIDTFCGIDMDVKNHGGFAI